MVIEELATFHTSQSNFPHNSTIALPIDCLAINLNVNDGDFDSPLSPIDLDSLCEDLDASFDSFSSDHFRIFEFKIRKCARSRSHDWTQCPYAHPGEKARRRDPRRFNYSGTSCPDFRKGNCNKGDTCEFAHGVFECWLHPSRYRTQLCKDGANCRRRICFFAHTPEQLRFLANGSPICDASFVSSPTSVLEPSPISSLPESPPISPGNRRSGLFSVSGLFGSVRGSNLRPGFLSLPTTPTRRVPKFGLDLRDQSYQEEPAMERVESGREIRAIMYAKLCKENSFG